MARPRPLHPAGKRNHHRTEPGKRLHSHNRPCGCLQATRPMANRLRPQTFQDHPLPRIRRPPGPAQAHARLHGPGRGRHRITDQVDSRHPPQHRPSPRPHCPARNHQRPTNPIQPRLHPPRTANLRGKTLRERTGIPDNLGNIRSIQSERDEPTNPPLDSTDDNAYVRTDSD